MGDVREKLVSITINGYSEYLQLSKARRAKPYVRGKCRVPKKYSDESVYGWVTKGRQVVLANLIDGTILTANSKAAGTPKLKKGNGQDIYNGNISRQARANLVRAIHSYFIPYITEVEPITDINVFPITLEILFYVHDKGKNNIDNDNKWIWRKCIQDTFVELGKIIDDNPHIVSRNEEETILIPDDMEQQLVINVYGRKEIN